MLVLSTLSLFLSLFLSNNIYLLSIIIARILFYYLSTINLILNSHLLDSFGVCFRDELGLFITLLTFFIILISFFYAISFKNFKLMSLTLLSLLVFCVQVFTTDRMFLLYFFYESSLVPILFIIVK